MNARLLGSLFRLRRLAAEFNHFWSYGVSPEDLAEMWSNSTGFVEFQEKLRERCAELDIGPVGGRYLEDAHLDEWLTAYFGASNQLRVSLRPNGMFRVEYTNGHRSACATYSDIGGELIWENPPQTARDAVRILRAIAVLAEADHRMFINAHLPAELAGEEAKLYANLPSWSHLWIHPSILENILPAR